MVTVEFCGMVVSLDGKLSFGERWLGGRIHPWAHVCIGCWEVGSAWRMCIARCMSLGTASYYGSFLLLLPTS